MPFPSRGWESPPVPSPPAKPGPSPLPAGQAGTYLYYDDLNAPVNRVMGLHGAFIVMPAAACGPQIHPL